MFIKVLRQVGTKLLLLYCFFAMSNMSCSVTSVGEFLRDGVKCLLKNQLQKNIFLICFSLTRLEKIGVFWPAPLPPFVITFSTECNQKLPFSDPPHTHTQGLIKTLGSMVIFDENQVFLIWVNMSSFAWYMSKSSSF